jgi:hypothetical protein
VVRRLIRRAEFLAANAGKRVPMPGFVLLGRARCLARIDRASVLA